MSLARYPILSLLLFFMCLSSKAQDCNCSQILAQSINGVEQNYALFKIKVNRHTQSSYDAFNRMYMEKAKAIKKAAGCQTLLNEWTAYFKDKHLWVTVAVQDEKITYSQQRLDLSFHRKRWKDPKIAKDPVEGLWEMEGYRAAIIPDPKHFGQFQAIIVSADNDTFKPGMLKMQLTKKDGFYDTHFYRRDSTMVNAAIRFTAKHTMLDDQDLHWRRLEPVNGREQVPSLEELAKIDRYRPSLKWLNESSAIFTLPSCSPRYAPVVDSLIQANKAQLDKSLNFIVDVRGNGGGSDRTYRALLPYILTKAIEQPKIGYYLSEENVKMFRELGILQKLAPADTAKRGVWATIQQTSSVSAAYYASSPLHVAILMDNKTASSGETFVLKSKGSERVTTFGSPTAGCIDGYNGNVVELNGASLRYPTSIRTLNLPQEAIDPFGILPDIPIADSEKDPVHFVITYLNQLERLKP